MPLIEIHDLNDPRLAPYHNVKDRELAAEGDLFVSQGLLVVQRHLRSKYPCLSVLCAQRKLDTILPDVPPHVPLYVVPDTLIHDIIGFKFHTGVMAIGQRPPPQPLESILPPPLTSSCLHVSPLTLLVLPNTNNVENLGSIARISAAFGVDALILGEECHDPFYRQALRVSMGTLFTLPVHRATDLKHDLRRLATEWNVELAATVLDPAAEPLATAKRSARLAILLGSEFTGLTPDYTSLCPRHLTIPMAPMIDSLNVSISAAIFLYHFTQLHAFKST